MSDLNDVWSASRCSADVINHVLCEYGEGNMGNGIRKAMVESLTIGYNICNERLNKKLKEGYIKGSIFTICAFGVISTGAWCVKKTISIHKSKKNDITFSREFTEGSTKD